MEIVETDPEVETEDEIVTGAETEEGETGVTQETTGQTSSDKVKYFCILNVFL